MPLRNIFSYACAATFSAMLLTAAPAAAKNGKTAEEPDTVPLFRGVQVSYDLAGTIMRAVSDYGQYEASARLNLKDKFFPAFEIGYGSSEHNPDPTSVNHVVTNAPYFRIGCDYNMANQKHGAYRVLVGLRYAFTNFTFKADATTTDPVWGTPVDYRIEESGCNHHWGEVLFAVDAKIWGPLRLGWSVRYRMPLASNEGAAGQVWYIPGFGKRGNKLGGTFNVTIELANNKRKKR